MRASPHASHFFFRGFRFLGAGLASGASPLLSRAGMPFLFFHFLTVHSSTRHWAAMWRLDWRGASGCLAK